MPRGQHLRNAQRFALVMQTALQIATGNLDLSKESDLILQPGQSGPSAATLSRSRAKLDVLAMYIRRWQWASAGFSESIISLCQEPSCARRCVSTPNLWCPHRIDCTVAGYDATKQGKELFITEEFATKMLD